MSRFSFLVSCVAVTLIGFAALPANASTIYIDFGMNGVEPNSSPGQMTGTYNGTFYNDLAVKSDIESSGGTQHTTFATLQCSLNAGALANSAALADTTGAATPWSISFQDELNDTSLSNVSTSGSGSNYVGLYPAQLSGIATTALKDSLFIGWGGVLEVILSGLDNTKLYDLAAYGSNGASGMTGTYTGVIGSGAILRR